MSIYITFGHARTVVIHKSEIELGGNIVLHRGFPVPVCRLGIILQNPLTFDIQSSEIGLSYSKTVRRQLSCPVRDNYDGRLGGLTFYSLQPA